MSYRKHLSQPWFSLIRDGSKVVEGRLFKDDFLTMKPGETIVFWSERSEHGEHSEHDDRREQSEQSERSDSQEEFEVEVVSMTLYPSFEEALRREGLSRMLPGVKTLREGVEIYRRYYSEEKERTYGVVAVEMRRI